MMPQRHTKSKWLTYTKKDKNSYSYSHVNLMQGFRIEMNALWRRAGPSDRFGSPRRMGSCSPQGFSKEIVRKSRPGGLDSGKIRHMPKIWNDVQVLRALGWA